MSWMYTWVTWWWPKRAETCSDNKVMLHLIRVVYGRYIYPTTLWSWALLERPPVVKPLDSFPALYETLRFITEFTRALHLSLSWARPLHPRKYGISLTINSMMMETKKDFQTLNVSSTSSRIIQELKTGRYKITPRSRPLFFKTQSHTKIKE
jgi:hypothetical protein